MTKRFLAGFVGRRVLPPLLLLVLIGAAYWLYSLHQTGQHDPRDFALASFLALVFFVVPLYLFIRTDPWTPQALGYTGLMWGDLVFYGSFVAGYLEWGTFTFEQRLDALRACASVGAILLVGGIVFYEVVRRQPEPTTTDPNVIHDRRSRRERRQGWCRDYCRNNPDDCR